jgi:Aspartyl protease/PDZ domain
MLRRRALAVSALLPVLIVFVRAQKDTSGAEKSSRQRPSPISVLSYSVAFLGIVFVPGTVNEQPTSLLFDTGGRGSLNDRWLQASHLQAQGGYRASGAGPAMVQASVLPNAAWRVGAAHNEASAIVLDLKPLEAIFGRSVDGILGVDFLERYVVELDPRALQFRIYDTKSFQPLAGAVAIPLQFDSNGYAGIEGALRFGDKVAHGIFQIDTGSNGAVDVYHPFALKNGLPLHPAEIDELSTGIGGHRHNRLERATAFQMGHFVLHGPVVAFNDADDIPSAHEYAGLVGMEILQRFIVAFDFPHKRMYLLPLPTISDPFVYDRSGLRLQAEPPSFQQVKIVRVISGSAAEASGVKPGDALLRVDGDDAGRLGLESIRQKCHDQGTLDLLLERDGRQVKAHLVLKPLPGLD